MNEDQIKWFFQNMKDRGVLPQRSQFYSFSIESEYVYLRYQIVEKTFGYKIEKKSILTFLRDWKLKQIL